MTPSDIIDLADELARGGEVTYICRINRVAERLGFVLAFAPQDHYVSLSDSAITVSTGINAWQKRYAIGHAIGHYMLGHHDEHLDFSGNIFSDKAGYEDKHASLFGGALIVPKSALRHAVTTGKCNSLQSAANMFGVTTKLMEQRLYQTFQAELK